MTKTIKTEAPKTETPKTKTPKTETKTETKTPKTKAPKSETKAPKTKTETPKTETPKTATPFLMRPKLATIAEASKVYNDMYTEYAKRAETVTVKAQRDMYNSIIESYAVPFQTAYRLNASLGYCIAFTKSFFTKTCPAESAKTKYTEYTAQCRRTVQTILDYTASVKRGDPAETVKSYNDSAYTEISKLFAFFGLKKRLDYTLDAYTLERASVICLRVAYVDRADLRRGLRWDVKTAPSICMELYRVISAKNPDYTKLASEYAETKSKTETKSAKTKTETKSAKAPTKSKAKTKAPTKSAKTKTETKTPTESKSA